MAGEDDASVHRRADAAVQGSFEAILVEDQLVGYLFIYEDGLDVANDGKIALPAEDGEGDEFGQYVGSEFDIVLHMKFF